MTTAVLPACRSRIPAPRASWARPWLAPGYWVLAGLVAVAILGFGTGPFDYAGGTLDLIWLGLALILLVGAGARRLGWNMIGNFLELFALFTALSLAGSLASAVLAGAGHPLVDPALTRIDTWLGFSWSAAIAWLAARPPALAGFSAVYASLSVQPVVLLGITCVTGRGGLAARFVTAWAVALATTLAISPFTPAVGNFIARGIRPAAMPGVTVPTIWNFMAVFGPIRDGTLTRLGFGELTGLITFPSFHAAGAVLLGWGFWSIRRLRWPMAALNGAMLAATVFVGGHYLVDVAAGALIAILGIVVARYWHR